MVANLCTSYLRRRRGKIPRHQSLGPFTHLEAVVVISIVIEGAHSQGKLIARVQYIERKPLKEQRMCTVSDLSILYIVSGLWISKVKAILSTAVKVSSTS